MATSGNLPIPPLTPEILVRSTIETIRAVYSLKPGGIHLSPIKIDEHSLIHPFYRSCEVTPLGFDLEMGYVYAGNLVPGLTIRHLVAESESLLSMFDLDSKHSAKKFIMENIHFVRAGKGCTYDIRLYVYFHWTPIHFPEEGEEITTLVGCSFGNKHHHAQSSTDDIVDDTRCTHLNERVVCTEHTCTGIGNERATCRHIADDHSAVCWTTDVTEEEWDDGKGLLVIKRTQK